MSDNILLGDFEFSCFLRNCSQLLPFLPNIPAAQIFDGFPLEQISLLKHCLYSYEVILFSILKDKIVSFYSLNYSISPYYILEGEFLDSVFFTNKFNENEKDKVLMLFNLPASLFPSHEINICHIIEKDIKKLDKHIKKWQKSTRPPIIN